MDFTTLMLALPIFLLLYSGMGMLWDMRRRPGKWNTRTQEGSVQKTLQNLSTSIGEMSFNQTILRIKGLRERLDSLLVRAGHPFHWKVGDTLFYKECLAIGGVFFLWAVDVKDPLPFVVGTMLAFWIPDIFLQIRGSNRMGDMQKQLPGFVDLVSLAVESGLDLVVAIERIAEKMKPSALREELQTLLQESRLGSPRKELLQRWAERTGLSDAQSLASMIIQSEEMGTPLVNVLRSYAEDMRNRRILRAEEMAGKIPVKILFPMMVFFFPIVFVIILGPVAMEFLKNSK